MGRSSLKGTSVLIVLIVYMVSISSVPYVKALKSDPGGPYWVEEGEEVTLIGENSENAENYNWGIVTPDNWYLTNDTKENAIFHAPSEVENNVTVEVRLTVTDNYGNSAENTTDVKVLSLIALPGGPYQVDEGDSITLDGSKSAGDNYDWSITNDPTGKAYLTNDSKENAIFHAPSVDRNENVTVKLLVTENGNYVENTTKVRVLDLLTARAGGPYQVEEGGTVTLDGRDKSASIENYSWSIVRDPTDNAYLTNDSKEDAIFHAPPDVKKNRNVKVRLIVTDGENNSDNDTTTVTIIDPLVCDPGGPYNVFENDEIELDGRDSNGYDGRDITDWSWKITYVPEEIAEETYLTDADTATPIFHAPTNVDADKEIDIKLLVTDEGYNSKEENTKVWVRDDLVADAGPNKTISEGATAILDGGNSSGYIESYSWSIMEDPTGEAYLTEASQEKATFHAPPTVNQDENIVVRLIVSSKLDNMLNTDNDLVVVTVEQMRPNPPLNLRVYNAEGLADPDNVVDPLPSFSSEFDHDNLDAIATKAWIQIGTGPGQNDVWDYKESELLLAEGERYEFTYDNNPLSPENTYYWRMKFYDNRRWGGWSSDEFTMGKLEDIIVKSVGFGRTENARDIVLYSVSPSKAASGLSKAYEIDPSSTAKVVENAWLYNPAGTLDIFDEMNPEDIANFLVQISKLPSTPYEAAWILDDMSEERARETVEAIIDLGEYEALNDIFGSPKLSEDKLNEIVEDLSEEHKSKLRDHLSSDVKDRISPEALGEETNWTLIAGILAAAGVAAAVVVARYEQIFGRFFEGPPKPAKRVPGVREWLGLIRNFLKSGKRRMAVRTDLPPNQALKISRAAIQRLGQQDSVGAERKGNRVFLLRKAERPGAEWTEFVQDFLESGKSQKLVKTDQPPERAKKLLQAAIQDLGKQDMVRAMEEEGIVYLARL